MYGAKEGADMSNLPFLQFYTGDWMREQSLRAFGERSAEIRGCWLDMLCLMFDSPERGVLLMPSGKPYTADALAGIFGLSVARSKENLAMMLEAGIYDVRQSDGAIISRRMIRDDVMHKVKQEAGRKGGNPALVSASQRERPKENGLLGQVLNDREQQLLKRLPSLRRFEHQPEAVRAVIRIVITRYKEFPDIFSFINTALSQGYHAIAISAALRTLFERSDAGLLKGQRGKAVNNFAYARRLLDNPELGDAELKKLLTLDNDNIKGLSDILKSIERNQYNGK